jgi:HK97 family phage major capsid protein
MTPSEKIGGSVRRKLAVAAHLAAMAALGANDLGAPTAFGSGRSHFGKLQQRGGPLAHTLAFDDDFAVLPEEKFQETVINTLQSVDKSVGNQERRIKTLEERQAEILKAMPKDIKEPLEIIEKLKRTANDQQANIDTLLRSIATFDEKIRAHARFGFGNPIERVQRDEEMRLRLNLAVRLACSKGIEMVGDRLAAKAKDILKVDIDELAEAQRAQNIRSAVNGAQQRALGEDTSPGSLLIDDKLAAEIYDTLATFGIWNTFQVDRLGTQTTKYPVTTARPTANFILTEAGTISDGSFTGTSVSNVVEVIAVLINVALQLLQDAEFDITSYVMNAFGESYSERLDHACLGADGTADATNGGMTGIFVGGTAATADAGAGADDTVEELEFEDWTRCLLTVDPIVLQRPSKWWMHPQILVRALSIKDLSGRPIFLTALEAPAPRSIGTILGYPVVPAYKAPSTNSANQKVAAFGDPAGLVVGLRSDYVFEASDHARWTTLERSFRGWGRVGVKIRRALAFAMLTLGA